MGILSRIKSWLFKPTVTYIRKVTDEELANVSREAVMVAAVRRSIATGQTVNIERPRLMMLAGETPEMARKRSERELDAIAELLGVRRIKKP